MGDKTEVIDYMPSHFYHWNVDKQFRAAIYFMRTFKNPIKTNAKDKLYALMIHAKKGPIDQNESVEEAFQMENNQNLIQELTKIKSLTMDQAKKEFVREVTLINPIWYKDVKQMIKFLSHPQKIYHQKDEDLMKLQEQEEIIKEESSTWSVNQNNQNENSDSEIYEMNKSIRRDYNQISQGKSVSQQRQYKNEALSSLMRENKS